MLKHADVIPIFKTGSSTDINNYRPISILPLLSKIFEKCIYSRLVGFMDRYHLININQYGFQKSKSTTDAILNFVDFIYGQLDRKNHIFGISIDLRKAFDCVCHEILLRKLSR